MLVKLLKWQSVLLIIILSSVACSKDSDEESTAAAVLRLHLQNFLSVPPFRKTMQPGCHYLHLL